MVATRVLGIPLTARVNADIPVRVNIVYDPTDPWAVTMDIATPGTLPLTRNWTRWHFSRDLLAEGLDRLAGDGDVRVFPDEVNTTVWVELFSPSGHAYVVFGRADIEKVLERIESLVEPGTEHRHVDWDSEWEKLATGPAGTDELR